jgi:isoleucyl-tRNA synthetase
MVELNREINWIPEHVKEGLFGNWIANARDWSISRNRFWGSPIPVWKSDDPSFPRLDVYGSLDEIERDFGVRPDDLHRPTIDELTRSNPDDPSGRAMMQRIPDVLDGGFDSGSMPFAQVHYPFENRDWFDNHSPADFIVEYVAQTRGWFYTLMVLGTALFDRPPFRNCICHGVTLAEDGQKLSKRLRNYPDPEEVFETHGSDALRWHLVSSPLLKGGDLKVEKDGKAIGDVVRNVLNPIWNAWYFFALYANSDNIRASRMEQPTHLLDRYILAKTRELVVELTRLMDAYEIAAACQRIVQFLDATNNWYIRRSRERFWKAERDDDKRAAYDTLFTVLETLCRVASPLLPFLTEAIYRDLTGEESVHLGDWPHPEELPADPELVVAMDRVRDLCSASLALRRAHDVRVRQPLRRLTVAGAEAPQLERYAALIADEVNVKEVVFQSDIESFASFRLKVDARAVGPRLGPQMKTVLAAAKAGDWTVEGDELLVSGERLGADEFQLLLVPAEGIACQALAGNDMVAVLDFDLDDSLLAEGYARDVVRAVQQARREMGLHVSDRIRLQLDLPDSWRGAAAFGAWIGEQTLAPEIDFGDSSADGAGTSHEVEIGGETLRFTIVPAS